MLNSMCGQNMNSAVCCIAVERKETKQSNIFQISEDLELSKLMFMQKLFKCLYWNIYNEFSQSGSNLFCIFTISLLWLCATQYQYQTMLSPKYKTEDDCV